VHTALAIDQIELSDRELSSGPDNFDDQPHTTVNMGRGPKKHQKRLSAPSHWLLDKLSGMLDSRNRCAFDMSKPELTSSRCLCSQGLPWSSQAPRLPASHHLPPQPSQVCAQRP
jgi:hypothetical protein